MGLLSSSKRSATAPQPAAAEPPVTPGLGPPIKVRGDLARIKSMSPAEFSAYQKQYQDNEEFLDRWYRAGPPGGVAADDQIGNRALHAWDQYRKNRARGMSVDDAAGWAANSEVESGGDYRSKQPDGPGRGLYHWGSNNPKLDRRPAFKAKIGVPIEDSTENQQFQFQEWELANTYKGARDKIAKAHGAGDKAAAITRYYEAPKDTEGQVKFRSAIAKAIARRGWLAEQDKWGP